VAVVVHLRGLRGPSGGASGGVATRLGTDTVRQVVRWSTRRAARSPVAERLVAAVDRYGPRAPGWLPVLMYHRVAVDPKPPDLDPILCSATPEDFAGQVRLLAEEYTPVSAAFLLDVRAGRRALPRRAVHVTFDDAYTDFAEHAWPVLRRYGVPVTLFVPTAYPDRPEVDFWWDRLYRAFRGTQRRSSLTTSAGRLELASPTEREHACRTLSDHVKTIGHETAMRVVDEVIAELGGTDRRHAVLSWADLRRLAAEGVTVAVHSRTHPMLDRLPPADLAAEVAGARVDLETALGRCPPLFAYPSGQWSPEVRGAVERAGYEIAFTTATGPNRIGPGGRGGWSARAGDGVDWLALNRIRVSRPVTPVVLRGLLLPWARGVLRLF
jgi:peptidoglycan/xylan/chitin deacetylase (PgdA/CDA1 family)